MISRRQFLKLAGLTAAVSALPTVAGAMVPLKCIAGWPEWWRCQSVGAHFGYQWDNLDKEHAGQIPHVKIGWDKPWTGEDAIRTAARSGSIMICNELSLWASVDQKVDILRRLFEVILDENPACYVLGPNDVVWEPYNGWLGFENIGRVANRYAQRYGQVPPFRGFGFHAYHYPRSQYRNAAKLPNMIWAAADRARDVYGNIDLHITETGSLCGEQYALDSIPLIREGLGAGIAAWFWFISHDDPGPWQQYPHCRIYDPDWSLTRVGRAFRDF